MKRNRTEEKNDVAIRMSAINYAFVWVLALTSLAHRVHNLTHLCSNTIDYRCYMSSHRIRMSGKKDKKNRLRRK